MASRRLAWALLLFVVASGLPAHPAAAASDCRCRFFGDYYLVGQSVCMRTARGYRVATCSMVLNNTSWAITRQSCMPGV